MNDLSYRHGGHLTVAETYEQPNVPEAQVVDVFLILKRQKWPLILGALIGLAAGTLHFATSSKSYYAAATVLVHEQTNNLQEELSASIPLIRNETAVLNEMQVLRSLQLAERVVRDNALHEDPMFMSPPVSLARAWLSALKTRLAQLAPGLLDAPETSVEPTEDQRILGAAVLLQREIGITRVGRTFSIEISAVLSDPELTAKIVNSFTDVYLADRRIANMDAADASAAWLRTHIEEVRQSANKASSEAVEFRATNKASDLQGLRELEQRAATLNDLHATLLGRLEMIAIEGSYPATNGRLLSPAITPRDPALPKAWRVLAAGLLLGLIAGMSVATVRELRETGLRSGEDVRKATGLAFLGFLPKFSRSKLNILHAKKTPPTTQRAYRSVLNWLEGPQKKSTKAEKREISAVRCAPSLLLPLIAPDSPYCETLKSVHATIEASNANESCKVIAIGSLNHSEGRSTVAANIAQLAALEGHRTLLIDADISNPHLSNELGFQETTGLLDVLDGIISLDDALFRLPDTNLDILPCKTRPSRTQLDRPGRIVKLLAQVRPRYDIIVLDFPPLSVSSDLKIALPNLDAVVLLAEWGKTSKEALMQYTSNEPLLKSKTVGVLLNGAVTQRLPQYGVATGNLGRRSHPGFA